MPTCQVVLEGHTYEAGIDLGRQRSRMDLYALHPQSLKKTDQKSVVANFLGTREEIDEYEVKNIRIGTHVIPSSVILPQKKEKPRFETDTNDQTGRTSVEYEEHETPIVLGNSVFQDVILVFDLPNDLLEIRSPEESFSYSEEWMEVPLIKERGLLLIQVEWKGEKKNFILDTGASENILFAEEDENDGSISATISSCEVLTIDGKQVEVGRFLQTNRSIHPSITGVLGLPFFENRQVVFDFPKQKIAFPVHTSI